MALLVTCVALVVACGGTPEPSEESRCPQDSRGTVTVLAASSMATVFEDIRNEFLAVNECITDVVFSFGSSATLAAQVVNGSPADVFVSASRATMDTVTASGLASGEPRVVARNDAMIMVSTVSPVAGEIDAVIDLVDTPGRTVTTGLCVTSAPCGVLADKVLAKAGTTRTDVADTEASSLEELVTKIELGEIDAGLVYRSDCAVKRESVRCMPIPDTQNAATEYLAVALKATAGARAWLDFLTSAEVAATLVDTYGFGAP